MNSFKPVYESQKAAAASCSGTQAVSQLEDGEQSAVRPHRHRAAHGGRLRRRKRRRERGTGKVRLYSVDTLIIFGLYVAGEDARARTQTHKGLRTHAVQNLKTKTSSLLLLLF